jgi:hypothetical protein
VPTPSNPARGKRTEHAKRANRVGSGGTVLFLVVAVALAALALYGVWVFWPSENPAGRGLLPSKRIEFFGWHRRLSRESLFFVMVAFAGALGGMVHATRSLAVYLGNRELKWSWAPFYILKPVLGAILATVLYFTLRAGLFSPSTSTDAASPYGFAAIGALAGLFSDQAVEKLRKIAEEVFDKPPPQKDHYAGPEVVTGDPVPSPTDATAVTLNGTVNPAGRETRWYFEYGESPDYGSATETKTLPAGTDDVDVEAPVTDLKTSVEYQYRLVAINDDGTTLGDVLEFTLKAPNGDGDGGDGGSSSTEDTDAGGGERTGGTEETNETGGGSTTP